MRTLYKAIMLVLCLFLATGCNVDELSVNRKTEARFENQSAQGVMEYQAQEKNTQIASEENAVAGEGLSPEGYATKTEIPEKTISPVTVDVVLMGDICFGTNYGVKNNFDNVFRQKGSRYFLEGVRPYLERADLRIANLENVFTDRTQHQKGKKYTYKAYSKDYLNVLKVNEINYVNVVNNHMADYFQIGFDDTLELLDENEIYYFGTNMKNSDSVEIGSVKVDKNRIFEKDGLKIGMTGYLGFNSSYPSKETIQNNIRELKQGGANFIIASLHGGGQNTTAVTPRQIELAHLLIEEGADMVYGHHPHMLQRTEEYKGKQIYYSLGNFLFIDYSGAKHPESVLVHLKVQQDEKGNITAQYENVPVLWSGNENKNTYCPTITNIPIRMERIRKILAGQLEI